MHTHHTHTHTLTHTSPHISPIIVIFFLCLSSYNIILGSWYSIVVPAILYGRLVFFYHNSLFFLLIRILRTVTIPEIRVCRTTAVSSPSSAKLPYKVLSRVQTSSSSSAATPPRLDQLCRKGPIAVNRVSAAAAAAAIHGGRRHSDVSEKIWQTQLGRKFRYTWTGETWLVIIIIFLYFIVVCLRYVCTCR